MDNNSLRNDFLNMASLMTKDYFMSPLNRTEELKELIKEKQEKLISYSESQGLEVRKDKNSYEGHLAEGRRLAISELGERCMSEGRRCPLEQAEISQLFDVFSNKYDLSDPRAYVIFKALVSNMLSAFRLQRYTQQEGSMMTMYSKDGMPYTVLNPAEDAKRKFNESLVTTIAKLDAIFEGQKIQADVNNRYSPKDFIDLFAKRVEDPIETTEIEYNEHKE